MDLKQSIRNIINNNRGATIELQINSFKTDLNPGDYKEAFKMYPVLNKYLHKDPFFKTVADIKQKEPFHFTADFKKEYRWVINLIEPHLERINLFIDFKVQFENSILKGDYKKSAELLSTVKNEFGVSLWSIENDLLLEELAHGSEANWNKLSAYLAEINNAFYEFVINSSSKRYESKLSHDSYLSQFQNDIANINTPGVVADFFVFKNLNFADYDYAHKHLEGVLYISNIFSVIDQYLILIDVIIYNLSTFNDTDKIFYAFINSIKDKLTNDVRVTNIYNVINEKGSLQLSTGNEKLLEALDFYYAGRFEESQILCEKGIKEYPADFEYYELYVKNLLNQGLDYTPQNISEVSENLLSNTYSLLKFEKSKEDGFRKLFKACLLLLNMNLGKQIFALLTEVEGVTSRWFITGFLNASFLTPKIRVLQKNRPLQYQVRLAVPDRHCFKVQSYKLGDPVTFDGPISLSARQNTLFAAINSYKQNNFKEAIEILNLTSAFDGMFYYYELKVTLLFNSYLQLDMLEEALMLFGRVFFDDSFVTRKLKYNDLYNKLKSATDRDRYNKLIELPILISLLAKEYDLYEVFDDFMISNGFSDPKEIDIETVSQQFASQKAIYFLHHVCTIDTLKYSTEYGSISEVEEDRIALLKQLLIYNPAEKLLYEKEINEIYRINSVRKVLKEVDEGRLYIDVNALKEIQTKKFNDDFKRFKEIEFSSSTQTLIGFNPSTKNWDKALSDKSESVEKFNSADYLAFKSIYLESRDNFLFSKEYGLDSCLSTRIRHGALKNHIRSVFEKLDLVTSKLNDVYRNNDVWENQLSYYPIINYQVQHRLREFSKEIDNLTIFVVEKIIQIQTEKTTGKEDGLFTFFSNDDILFKFYNQNKSLFHSVESTIDLLLTSLTNRTLVEIQRNVVDYFENILLKQYHDIIESTIADLRNYNLPPECQLVPAFIKSSTDIQQELESISNWFYLNTTSSTTLLSIETLIDASVELTNKINPNYRINPKITLNCEPFGVYSNLVFLFNILFNNIIEHSRLPFDQVNVEIEFDMFDEQHIRIKVANNVSPAYDYSDDLAKLKRIKESWNDHSSIERSNKEGESGFDKIKRILLYEAFSKTDKFEYEFSDNKISVYLFFPFVKY